MSKPEKQAKAQPDWERIELDYRAGIKSLREIADGSGVSHVTIKKHADREGWERDLAAKIKARAEALVNKAEVNSEVNTEKALTEKAVVEANAEAITRIRLTHRKDIARARTQAMKLLEELEHTSANIDLVKQLETLVAVESQIDPKLAEKRAAALHKVMELPTRTGVMKALAETMTKLIALEREAYSLETAQKEPGDTDPDDVLRGILARIDGAGTDLPAHVGRG